MRALRAVWFSVWWTLELSGVISSQWRWVRRIEGGRWCCLRFRGDNGTFSDTWVPVRIMEELHAQGFVVAEETWPDRGAEEFGREERARTRA